MNAPAHQAVSAGTAGGTPRRNAHAFLYRAEGKGLWASTRWLLLRRAAQLGFLALFLVGPVFGWWIVKGDLASSLTFNFLPLTDPMVLLQSLIARHGPETQALTGALIVLGFYLAVGGRVYCSWVCPVNLITDAASALRRRLRLGPGLTLPRGTRYAILAGALLASAVIGTIAWETLNPVTLSYRALLFGAGLAALPLAAIFLFDLLIAPRGWCGHLCPVGAFYAILGSAALVRVAARRRRDCNDCLDCYAVCPEPQVIPPALKGEARGVGPVILAGACTNCGRCIDVCSKHVFEFSTRSRGLARHDRD